MLNDVRAFRMAAADYVPGSDVSLDRVGNYLRVEFHHPASIGAGLLVPADSLLSVEDFVRWLESNRETVRMHAATGALRHMTACRKLVIHAATFGWEKSTFVQVVELMMAIAALDKAEAEWLVATYTP